jgi:hypothetical protein
VARPAAHRAARRDVQRSSEGELPMKLTKTGAALAAGTLSLGMWIGIGSTLASAASPSQSSCTSSGGTFYKVNGTVTCTFATSDPVGNSESSGGQSQSRDTTTTNTGQGNDGNKATSGSTCVGPGNAKCP